MNKESTATPSPRNAPSLKERLSGVDRRAVWLIFIACAAVSMVVAAMASLNTALAEIAVDTGADVGQMTWIIDGYTLTLAAFLLPAGAIGDRVGRRGILIAGLIIFAAASLVAIWTVNPTQLIATRCLAGLGAAFIMPATLSLITSGVPEDKRSIGVSIWAAVAGVGAIAGFFVTGILLQFFSWHSIFITFAVSATVTALLSLTIGSSRDSDPGRFDLVGTTLSILAITGIVFGLLEAPHRGWSDPLILIGLVGGLVLIVAFCFVELKRRSPLLDVRLFRNRAFGAGSLSVLLQFLASFGLFFLFLQRLQLIFDYSPLRSAVALVPMVVGTSVFALLGNWIAVRFESLRFVISGGILVAGIGILCLGLVPYDTYWGSVWMISIVAIGIGLATAPSTTAIMANTPLDNQGIGSAVNDTARELGAAIGIALAGSILAAGYSSRIGATADLAREQLTAAGEAQVAAGSPAGAALVEQAPEAAEAITRSLAEASQVVDSLPPEAGPLAQQLSDGAQMAFIEPMNQASTILGAILIVGALFLAWLTPRKVVGNPAITGEGAHTGE